MFHSIAHDMLDRMKWLEMVDARDRQDGTPRTQRLRQIPVETGHFLALLAAGAPDGDIIEIGTSGGYSTLWLVLAGQESGRKVTTFEVRHDKVEIARETFRSAGVEDWVTLIEGDALIHLARHDRIAFCFLDAEKEDYETFYELVVPRLVPGGILVADNVISHSDTLRTTVSNAYSDDRVDCTVVPIGKGELVCRRVVERG